MPIGPAVVPVRGGRAGVRISPLSGGRVLRATLHGLGVSCSITIPDEMTVLEDDQAPRTITAAELVSADAGDDLVYDGVLDMHRDFIDCIRTGERPCTDIRDTIHTARLVDRMIRGGMQDA